MNQLGPIVALACAVALVGCKPPKQAGDENNFGETPSSTSPPPDGESKVSDGESGWSGKSETKETKEAQTSTSGFTKEQEEQMIIALRRGGDKAGNCLEVVAGAQAGEGEVQVTMDGQKGRVTDVTVGSPWAGTPVEPCIKRSFVGEIILPFEGPPKMVPYTVKLEKKKAAGTAPAKAPEKKP